MSTEEEVDEKALAAFEQKELAPEFQTIIITDIKKKYKKSLKQVDIQKDGEEVPKFRDGEYDVGDYLMSNDNGIFYNIEYAIKNNLLWLPYKITAYVSKDDENRNNLGKETIRIIRLIDYKKQEKISLSS